MRVVLWKAFAACQDWSVENGHGWVHRLIYFEGVWGGEGGRLTPKPVSRTRRESSAIDILDLGTNDRRWKEETRFSIQVTSNSTALRSTNYATTMVRFKRIL